MDSYFSENWGTMLFCVWRVLGIAIVVRRFWMFLVRDSASLSRIH